MNVPPIIALIVAFIDPRRTALLLFVTEGVDARVADERIVVIGLNLSSGFGRGGGR